MAVTTGSVLARKQNQIKELIGDNVRTFGFADDPVFRGLVQSSASVEKLDGNGPGRDYLIKQRFQLETGGVVESGAFNSQFARDGDLTRSVSDTQYLNRATQTYPDALQSAASTVFGLTAQLTSLTFSFPMTVSELRMESTEANIAENLAPKFAGVANQLKNFLINGWYTKAEDNYKVATLPAQASITNDNTARSISFVPTEENAFVFHHGMTVDIFNAAGTIRLNETGGVRIPVFVEAVDTLRDRVTLVASETAEDGSSYSFGTVFAVATTEDGIVTHANMHNASASPTRQNMYGYSDLFKHPNSSSASNAKKRIFGDNAITSSSVDYIDVIERPEFASMYYDAGNGHLTERAFKHIMTRTMASFEERGYTIDTVVGSLGMWDTFDDNLIAKERIDRTNRPSSLSLGFNGEFMFDHDGRSYAGTTSKRLDKDRIIGYRRQGNYSLVTLPRPKGSTGSSIMGNDVGGLPIEFAAPYLTGTDSIQLPVYKTVNGSSLPTDVSQVPGHAVLQFMPTEQIPGLVIENITNNRIQGGGID